jgi:hypothetical protein
MSHDDTIQLIGRGPYLDLDRIDETVPVAAVSSSIFRLEGRRVDHMIAFDGLGSFINPKHTPSESEWRLDPWCRWWEFHQDRRINKHLPHFRNQKGFKLEVELPPRLDERYDAATADLIRQGVAKQNAAPWVHCWGDLNGVTWWEWKGRDFGPGFLPGEDIGHADCQWVHSLLFAVQVVHQLGYRRIVFNGCDLEYPRTSKAIDLYRTIIAWHEKATELGFVWCSTAPLSPMTFLLRPGREGKAVYAAER